MKFKEMMQKCSEIKGKCGSVAARIKPDLTNKKHNYIAAAVCLVLALAVLIVSACQFSSFRNYQTEFVLREGVVDDVLKFHEYSRYLEGTSGDSDIYVINGTENTVALVKEGEAGNYANGVPEGAKLCAVEGSDAQIDAATATLGLAEGDIALLGSAEAAAQAVKDGTYDAAVLRHGDAKKLTGDGLAIAEAELEKVPSLLVIGGTHPNEPAGQLTATLFLENAVMERGILYVVTELNKSAYSHSQPQEGSPWYYEFEVDGTTRTFKYGARASNPVDQWPTPDVYTHSSGQQLSSSEVRNINRAYPGSETGTFTEQIAWAITNFVNTEQVTMVIDLHEASPEYEVINACVYHQDSAAIASNASLFGFMNIGEDIKMEVSALNLHGLTHRELGDYTSAYVFLFETSNASQGKIHGKFTSDLILYDDYQDKYYEASLEKGLLYAPAVSINVRVARHTESVSSIIEGFNLSGCYSRSSYEYSYLESPPESQYLGDFLISGIPDYTEVTENGVANYLLPSEK